jgi:hypothetical protein
MACLAGMVPTLCAMVNLGDGKFKPENYRKI